MALLRKNQPAITVIVKADEEVPMYVHAVRDDGNIVGTSNRREAMQATWRNLRDVRAKRPDAVFHSDLDPNA